MNETTVRQGTDASYEVLLDGDVISAWSFGDTRLLTNPNVLRGVLPTEREIEMAKVIAPGPNHVVARCEALRKRSAEAILGALDRDLNPFRIDYRKLLFKFPADIIKPMED